MEHARHIVAEGPHPPGSAAQKCVGVYLITQLKSYGLPVRTQSFTTATPTGPVEMVNIWGTLKGSTDEVIILASHYDSKYFPAIRFVGANDGAASSGLVLELARLLARDNPVDHTLWFVFFDGEEAIGEWTDSDSLYGSRHFVSELKKNRQVGRIKAMILLDLVGGKQLRLLQDTNSTPQLNRLVWAIAEELGHNAIFSRNGWTSAVDDHIPFKKEGVPVLDLIDLNYAHWHRPSDTLDKLSPENLEIVGNVVIAALPAVAQQ